MELFSPDFLKVIANAGTTLIVFIIWYISFNNARHETSKTNERLFKMMEQDIQYKELLIGILTRLEIKIDTQQSNPERRRRSHE